MDRDLSSAVQSTVDIFVKNDKINLFRVAFIMVCPEHSQRIERELMRTQERLAPLNITTGKGLGGKFNETVRTFLKTRLNLIFSL